MAKDLRREEVYPVVKDKSRMYYVGKDGFVYSFLLEFGRKKKMKDEA